MSLNSLRIKLGKGLHLNLIKTDKFKSNLLSYYFTRPLSKMEVSKNALLPLVLKSGTQNYPNNLELEKKMEELYGASLSISVNKRGEKQIIRFTMEWANGDYLGDSNYDYQVTDLLREIIYSPLLDKNGVFSGDYVSREKQNLRKIIESRINNKRSYAIERCIEEMCKNEKFSLYQLGYVEDLPSINAENLYHHYKCLLDTSPIEIFYVGHYDDGLLDYLKENNSLDRENIVTPAKDIMIRSPQTKKVIREELDINQGKLVMGYRSGIKYNDKLYNAFLIGADILGGGPNSKLFKYVREEASLAYYISTTIYKFKSILIIDGGIEFQNFDKAIEIIKRQLEDLKNGIFTEDDINKAKKSLKTSSESIKDSIFLISEFFFSRVLSNDNRSLDQMLEAFEEVRKNEIVEAVKDLVVDTIYFMEGKS